MNIKIKINIKVKSDGLGHGQGHGHRNRHEHGHGHGKRYEHGDNTRHEHGQKKLGSQLRAATAPYFYGSILLRALTPKIIVVLTYVSKKQFLSN
jgi:hypothetical protein